MKSYRFFAIALLMFVSAACKKTIDATNVETILDCGVELEALDVNGDTIIAVGGERYFFGSIFTSYDAGQNWNRFDSISEKALYATKIISPGRFIAAGYDGKYFESTDAGNNWTMTQLNWENIRGVESHGNYTWFCSGKGLNQGFITRIDNPTTPWIFQFDSFENEFRSIIYDGDSILYCAGYGLIMHSNDNGNSWQPTSAEGDFFIGIKRLGEKLYTAGMNGTVLESSDNGNSWTHLKHGNSPTQLNTLWNAMDLNDDGIILVGENGKVLWYNFNDEKFRKLDIGTDDDLTSVKISYQVAYACTRQGHMIKFNLP